MSSSAIANFKVPLGPLKAYKNVIKWFTDLAESDELVDVREAIKLESMRKPGKRSKAVSQTLRDALEDRFKQSGCRSGVACMRYIFEHYIRYQLSLGRDPKLTTIPVMRAINKILPLTYPEIDQRTSYKQQVTDYNLIIRAELGDDFQAANHKYLQFEMSDVPPHCIAC